MRVISYDPNYDSFFVAATWDEYRQLAAKYEIDMGSMTVEESIEEFKAILEDQIDMDASYPQYIMDLYGIDYVPDVCLMIDRDLSLLKLELYDYPFGHMWNGWSPWRTIETVPIDDLSELAALECIEKEPREIDPADSSDREETAQALEPGSGRHTVGSLLEHAIEIMEKSRPPYNLLWSRKELTAQKLGMFCEYYAKMTLLSYGVSVYTAVTDDHGVDFVAESRFGFLKFQVKGIRTIPQYVFMPKEYFDIEDDAMFVFLLLLTDGEHPDMYILPTSAWRKESRVFVSRDYKGKKSKPEYGINISKRNLPELEQYRIEHMLSIF